MKRCPVSLRVDKKTNTRTFTYRSRLPNESQYDCLKRTRDEAIRELLDVSAALSHWAVVIRPYEALVKRRDVLNSFVESADKELDNEDSLLRDVK